jgi:hypothetical protein
MHGAILDFALARQRESRFRGGALPGDEIGDETSHCRAVLEPVTRAPADQPDV